MKITNEIIAQLLPCQDRHDNYLKFYKNRSHTKAQFLGLRNITHKDKLWVAFRLMSKKNIVLAVADMAESVLHIFETKYPNDKRPRLAIEAIKQINTNTTRDACAYAADAAHAYAHAHVYAYADAAANAAANAAYVAAYAAYAAYAYAAADAYDDDAAANAAANAAHAYAHAHVYAHVYAYDDAAADAAAAYADVDAHVYAHAAADAAAYAHAAAYAAADAYDTQSKLIRKIILKYWKE